MEVYNKKLLNETLYEGKWRRAHFEFEHAGIVYLVSYFEGKTGVRFTGKKPMPDGSSLSYDKLVPSVFFEDMEVPVLGIIKGVDINDQLTEFVGELIRYEKPN